MSDPEQPRSPFQGSLEFDTEAWHRAGCPTLESAFVAWQAAEERANAAEAELRETAGELAKVRETVARMRKEWFSPEYGARAAERLQKAEADVRELEAGRDTFLSGHVATLQADLRTLKERVEKAIAELEDDSDSNLTDNIDLALAALRG